MVERLRRKVGGRENWIARMAESSPPERKRPPGSAALAFALALLGLLAEATPAPADLRPPARPRGEPPMRFVRVVSADPACQPNCPEWLSAEGRIEPGSARAFAEAVERLNGRRLPILIHSPGGSVPDAIAMGELIRAKGLAVAVARTLIANCPEAAPKCPDGPGKAITGGATCASACVLVLAGGVERLAGPVPLIGVHQITTLVKEPEGLAHLMSTRKLYEQQGIDAEVTDYLAAMGVGEPVMTLARKTPAASVRWLSLAELRASRLTTLALDAAEPIAISGANGLNGRAFDGDRPRADLVQVSVPVPGRGATLEISFRFRRGGGAVEAEATARPSETRQAAHPSFPDLNLTLSAASGAPFELRTGGTIPARALIPRERFCALAHAGVSGTAPAQGAPQGSPPALDLSAMDGAKTLTAEACP
jgi:hypothetical protein